LKRFEEGRCPLCDKELGKDFKRVEYKGKKIWICQSHRAPDPSFIKELNHATKDSHPYLKKLGTG